MIEQLQERKNALQMIAGSITLRGADDPETFLNELYSPYQVGGSTVIVDSNVDLYFAPSLAKAFHRDQAASRRTNSPPNLDGDPLVNSREQVRFSEFHQTHVVALDPTHARGVVSYRTSESSPPAAVTVDLIHTERGWRIANIYYPSTNGTPKSSLAEILVGPPAAASTPDCAFHPTLKVDTQSAMKAGDWLPITWSRCSPRHPPRRADVSRDRRTRRGAPARGRFLRAPAACAGALWPRFRDRSRPHHYSSPSAADAGHWGLSRFSPPWSATCRFRLLCFGGKATGTSCSGARNRWSRRSRLARSA